MDFAMSNSSDLGFRPIAHQYNESGSEMPCHGFNWGAMVLPLLIVWGLTGNLLVCIAIYTDKKLQNVTNYFLFSLAVADLLVCGLVMPMSILVEMRNGHWHEGMELCLVYVSGDVFLCSASIVHMSVISLDRYMGISRPLKTRNKSKFVVVFKIVFVWVTTCLISSPLAVLAFTNPGNIHQGTHCEIFNHWFKIYGSTLTFLIPMGIMVVTYHKTTKLLKQQAQLLCGNNPNQTSGLRRAMNRSGRSKPSSAGTASTQTTRQTESRRVTLTQPSMDPLLPPQDPVGTTEGNHNNLGDKERNTSLPKTSISSRTSSYHRHSSGATVRGSSDQGRIGALMTMHVMNTTTCPEVEDSEDSGSEDHKILDHLRNRFKERTMTLFHFNKRPSAVQDVASEQKATRVLGVVFSTFFICWTPFFTLNFTLSFCGLLGGQCYVPPEISSTFLWLGYISSTINPLIYTIFNRRFRQTFSRLIRCHCRADQVSLPGASMSNGALSGTSGRKPSFRMPPPSGNFEKVNISPYATRKIPSLSQFPSDPAIRTTEVQLSADVTEFQTTC